MGTFCSQLWDGVYINRSGEVFACCHQSPKPYGNIHNGPLREIINSPAALQTRAESLAGQLSCYGPCNLLDKEASVPWGHERSQLNYSSLKRLHVSFGEACNIRCTMCDNPQRHRDNPILLDPAVIIRNVDLSPFGTIMLRGGEPLFIRECLRFMEHLEKLEKRYSLYTNGLLIDEKMASRLARNGHAVVVSLNGATKRGHEAVNRGSRFERVVENCHRLREARDRIGSELTITGHMTITTSNLHEVPHFLRSFRQLGFDRVNFGFVKETVPPYLAAAPDFAERLRQETAEAMAEVGGPAVDALRLELLGLWSPDGTPARLAPSLLDRSMTLLPMIDSTKATGKPPATTEGPLIGDPVLGLLRAVDRRGRVIAFLRHSERDSARSPADVSMDQVRLTEKGKVLARRFGRELPLFDRTSVSHTSIPRSQETAVELDAGFREAHPGTPPILAGKNPCFSVIYRGTVDKTARDKYRVSLRGQAFTQMWLDGEVPPTIMRPARDTVNDFLRDVNRRIRTAPPSSLHIHIGHDREIEVVRTTLLGGRLGDLPLMEFLDGLVFYQEGDGGIQVRWRDRKTPLASPGWAPAGLSSGDRPKGGA